MLKSSTGGEQVDAGDLQEGYNRLYEVLSHNMPAGSGFGAGFLMGLRSA